MAIGTGHRGTQHRIVSEALTWPGVSRERGRFGSVRLMFGRRELGHLHGDRTADIPLPRQLRDRLVAEGSADPHRYRPASGWVTVQLTGDDASAFVLALLRANYERAAAQRRRARGPGEC